LLPLSPSILLAISYIVGFIGSYPLKSSLSIYLTSTNSLVVVSF